MTVSVTSPVLKPDILIFGGGIAGLWLINHLQQRGYQCLLLETGTLGGAQTLASQGIIHGGLKYALGGGLSSESEAIAGMPDRWRAAIDGRDKVDLSGLRVLADGAAHASGSGVPPALCSAVDVGKKKKRKRKGDSSSSSSSNSSSNGAGARPSKINRQ